LFTTLFHQFRYFWWRRCSINRIGDCRVEGGREIFWRIRSHWHWRCRPSCNEGDEVPEGGI